jgi:spermidine synthase
LYFSKRYAKKYYPEQPFIEVPSLSIYARGIVFFLFALSGFSGLIYESIWTRYLTLFLGHAAYAQSLVLAIFMGGMAIGSWACSRYSDRWGNLLRGYAVAEGVIGLCALVFHSTFVHLIDLSFTVVIPRLGGPLAVSTFKWVLSALMILPQSVLLGMTFPLMSSGILRLFPESPGKSLALLYFSNSIGAALGVLASGFLLIRLAGLPGTIGIAGLTNIVLAIAVWVLTGPSARREERRAIAEAAVPDRQAAPRMRLFLLAALVTGAASFIYEIGWIRMLSLVLGITTTAFELMLSAFILGLAIGGIWIQRRIDRIADPVRWLGRVQVVMGVMALATLLLYGRTFNVMQWLMKTLPRTDGGFALFNLSSSAIAMAIMLPATVCAGMTLPLITVILLRQGSGEGSIGAVYSANTVGAIIGVFFAVHLGMPLLGLKGLITAGAGLDIALGISLLWTIGSAAGGRSRDAVFAAVGGSAVMVALLFVQLDPYKMASGVYRLGYLLNQDDGKLLYHKDGKTATVSCFLEQPGHMVIKTNGKTDASMTVAPGLAASQDEVTNILLGVLPLLYHPQAQTAAAFGLGSGLTSQTLLCNPRLRQLDTVEIEQGIVEAAKNFRPHVELVYTDPRSRIHADDARTYFSTYNKKYDVIVSEPSALWVSGLSGLFSEEFYHLISRHLNDDGLFVQWLHVSEVNVDLVASVLKTVSTVFPDFAVYSATDLDMIVVSKKNGLLPQPDYSVLRDPSLAASLSRINIRSEQDISIRRIGTKKNLEKLLAAFSIRTNSDYYPVLDQNAAKTAFLVSSAMDLSSFGYLSLPVKELLGWSAPRREATRVMPSPFYVNSQETFVAMGLRDYFQRGTFDGPDVPGEMRQIALALRHACGGTAALSEDERLGRLYNLSVAMVPHLSPSELEPLWTALESGACAAQASSRERLWRGLFRATGRRDAAHMLQYAGTLLASEHDIPWQAREYLLASGMLGALARGDRAASYGLWERYKTMVFGRKQPDVLFRLLLAESVN